MAYITPNSTVWLYKGVPLDPNYENTYWFPDKATQKAEFDKSYLAYTFTAQSYCRATGNSIRIQRNPDDLINCNYMAFRNTSFGNKIFYAFIDEVAYINNSTAEVRFTIDVLQTYFRDVIFMPSYIEREHSATDEIGDNIMPEPSITTGTILYQDEQVVPSTINFANETVSAITIVVCDRDFKLCAEGSLLKQIYYRVWEINGVTTVGVPYAFVMAGGRGNKANEKLEAYIQNGGKILSVYCIPPQCITMFRFDTTGSDYDFLGEYQGGNPNLIVPFMDKPTKDKQLNGYIPKNKKLYTYPFCFLRAVTGSGDSKDFQFEFFSGERAEFQVIASAMTDEQTETLAPVRYSGVNNTKKSSAMFGLKYSEYPSPTLSTNEYSQLRGQERLGYVINGLRNYLSYSLSGNTTQPVTSKSSQQLTPAQQIYGSDMGKVSTALGIGGRAAGALLSQVASKEDMKNNTVTINGKGGSAWTSIIYEVPHFILYTCTMNRAALATYDSYFTRFGYTINRVKFPYFIEGKGRKTFNYIKTNGASIAAKDAPADAVEKMKQIFDSGTTVWLQLGNVGNLEVSNDPIK